MLLFLGRGQVLYLLRQLKPRNHWQKLLEVFCYVFHKIKCNNSIAFITFFFPWNIIKKRWIAKSFLHKPCLFLKEINYFKGFRSLIFFFFFWMKFLIEGTWWQLPFAKCSFTFCLVLLFWHTICSKKSDNNIDQLHQERHFILEQQQN